LPFNRLPDAHVQLSNLSSARCRDANFHFHRFEQQQRLSFFHPIADVNEYAAHLSGHRSSDNSGTGALAFALEYARACRFTAFQHKRLAVPMHPAPFSIAHDARGANDITAKKCDARQFRREKTHRQAFVVYFDFDAVRCALRVYSKCLIRVRIHKSHWRSTRPETKPIAAVPRTERVARG